MKKDTTHTVANNQQATVVIGIPGLTKENAANRILSDPRARAVYERLAKK